MMTQDLTPLVLPFDTAILAGRVAASSMAIYQRDFRSYLAYAGTAEMALSSTTLARWRTYLAAERHMSPHTINRMLSAVKRLIKEAAQQGFIAWGVYEQFKHVDGASVSALKGNLRKHNRVKIEPALIQEVVDAFDTTTLVGLRNRAMFLTFATSGLRVGEIVTLTHEQIIERDGGYLLLIRAEQGKNLVDTREANIAPIAVAAIRAWVEKRPVESPFLFTSFEVRGDSRPSTRHIGVCGAHQVINRVFAQHGLAHVKPHDLRRYVGTQLFKTNMRDAQRALGHKSMATTAAHYDLNPIRVGATDHLVK